MDKTRYKLAKSPPIITLSVNEYWYRLFNVISDKSTTLTDYIEADKTFNTGR